MSGEDPSKDSGLGRNPHGDGGARSSPDIAARPPSLRIQRNCRLRTILRVDPTIGIGVYTESAKIQRLLERSGLPVSKENQGVYCVIPAARVDVATQVLLSAFPRVNPT